MRIRLRRADSSCGIPHIADRRAFSFNLTAPRDGSTIVYISISSFLQPAFLIIESQGPTRALACTTIVKGTTNINYLHILYYIIISVDDAKTKAKIP